MTNVNNGNVINGEIYDEENRAHVYGDYRILCVKHAGLIKGQSEVPKLGAAFHVAFGLVSPAVSMGLYLKYGDGLALKMIFGAMAFNGAVHATMYGVIPLCEKNRLRNLKEQMAEMRKVINMVYPDTQWDSTLCEGVIYKHPIKPIQVQQSNRRNPGLKPF